MTEQQAFLAQASSDYRVFQILLNLDRRIVPACHPLHYFQMSTEKLAKAALHAVGQPSARLTHVAFSHIPYVLARSDIASRLGWKNGKAFRQFLKRSAPIFRQIDELNPAVGTRHEANASRDQPNVEYPWHTRDRAGTLIWEAPVNRVWPLMEQLRSGNGAQVIQFVEVLLERFDAIFR